MTYFTRAAFAAAIAGVALAAAPAGAAVLIDQAGAPNQGGASSNGNAKAFDDFRLSETSTITGIGFWSTVFGTPAGGTYEVSFWTVANNFFVDLAAGPVATRTVTTTSTGAGLFTAYDSGTFDSVVLEGGVNYFVSIYGGSLEWARSPNTVPGLYGNEMMMLVNQSNGAQTLNALNLAFRLEGVVGTVAAPVPEPATWAMMIAGFALAGAALRRAPGRAVSA